MRARYSALRFETRVAGFVCEDKGAHVAYSGRMQRAAALWLGLGC